MNVESFFRKLLWWLALPFACISFCLGPLTNDTRIFLAAEAIAGQFYPLPYGWDAAYEVKPIGNRILNWIFYKIADAFVPFTDNNYFLFGIAVKICGIVILLACCWYISGRLGKKSPYTFPLLVLAFICQANFGIMMSEWFAVLFSLVVVALCLGRNKDLTLVAGVLCVFIALLKGITLFMVIPIVCAVLLLGEALDWKRFISGFFAGCVAVLVACLAWWPYQVSDILMSSKVAHVGHYDITTLLSYFWLTQTGIVLPAFILTYIPVILCSIPVAILIAASFYIKEETRRTCLFAAMWAIPVLMILVQSEFIGYHYLVLAFPAIISFLLFSDQWPDVHGFTRGAIVFLVATFLVFNCFFGSYSVYESEFWQMKEVNADRINARFDLIDQSSILYLDPGDASYYFHANSSCRFITPVPVERHQPGKWDMSGLPQYKELKACILDYRGEYILTDVSGGSQFSYTFFQDPDIAAMIAKNYTKVDSRSWDVFRKIRAGAGASDAQGGT